MDIYELLDKIITNESFGLSSNLFKLEDKEMLDENDKPLFDILKIISTLGMEINDCGITFHPMFVMADGRRTFSIEDITDSDYENLKAIDLNKIPLVLRCVVADIIWTQKKIFKAAHVAAESYWELCQICYVNEDKTGTVNAIKRAMCISIQTNQTQLYSSMHKWFKDFFIQRISTENSFLSLRIMQVFIENRNFDISSLLSVLDKIISLNSEDILIIERAYELKTKCLHKLGKKECVNINNTSLAQHYVDFAEKIVKDNICNAMRAVKYFEKAIFLYRNNGLKAEAEKTHKKLLEIQKEIPNFMAPISFEFDIKYIIDNIKVNMKELTFEESIIRLAQVISFNSIESIKTKVIEESKRFVFLHLSGKKLINSSGQTIFVLPPLDINNPENDPKLLELYMHQNLLKQQQIIGDILVKNILLFIKDRFEIENSMLDFLVKDNPIIPEGRERIFQNAICMFLRGEFYEAIHILGPQTENLFRDIAKEVGGLTVTLESDGSSMEKVLSSIFNLPEILDAYDNDILFTFRGLLNEQAGANIRNEVAHGILEETTCSSGVYLYFGAAVIKLLTYTSVTCYKILKNNEKLKKFEIPNKDALNDKTKNEQN